jgi:hypothetical protein
MKRFWLRLCKFLVLGILVYFLLPSPLPFWHRRIVRDDPLKAPITVTAIRGATLISTSGEFTLAGVTIPNDSVISARATDFLRCVTHQGVAIIRTVQPAGSVLLRCEPRIWHWCGNDSVAAHYQQFNLNELLLAFGYATFDNDAAVGLTESERLRLRTADYVAQQGNYGIWSPTFGVPDHSFRPEFGLNISNTISLPLMLEFPPPHLKAR